MGKLDAAADNTLEISPEDVMRIERARLDLLGRRMAALGQVGMLPGHPDKAFVRDVCHDRKLASSLTLRQQALVLRLVWRYRRQIHPALLPRINPDDPFSPDAALMHHCPARPRSQELAHG